MNWHFTRDCRLPIPDCRLSIAACLILLAIADCRFPIPAHALSIMYPGEGIKTVVTAAGVEVKKVLDADNPVSRAANGVVELINPDNAAMHFDAFNMDLTLSGYRNSVSGNKTRSFLKEGNHTQEQVDIGGKKRYVMFGGGEFDFKASVRATEDPQVDATKNTRLQGLYGTFTKKDDYALRLGNVSGSFSSYSLSSSANVGAQLTKDLGGKNPFREMQVYLARPTRHLEGTSFDKYVYGFRMAGVKGGEGTPLDKLGMSYVKTKDAVDSIKDTNARPANAVENDVVSVDANFKLADDITVQAEWAQSRNDPNTQRDVTDIVHGQAYKLNAAAKLKARFGFEATSVTSSLEVVDPDFRSASGGGSPDAQRFAMGLTSGMKMYGNAPDLQMTYSGSTNRNNLEGQIARRTTSDVHNWNIAFKPFQKSKAESAIRKNMNMTTAIGYNQTQASDNSTKSEIGNQSYQMSTSSGKHTFSTFYKYQITIERTPATGDRRNASQGFTYGYKELEWVVPSVKPFKTDMTFNATQTRDKTMDAPGRSYQRQYGVSSQTKVNDEERLDVDFNLGLTDNYNVNSDIRTENLKCAYVISKFIQDDGNMTVTYTSNKTREEVKTQDYREEVWRADVALKWGGPPEKMVAQRAEVEAAVKAILAAYEKDDPFEFMKMVSPNFKGNRENVLRSVQDQLAAVDNIKYDGVWLGSFVPGDTDVVEVSFTWQRRWRVAATGAEERAQGTALFRLEKSSGQWLLQEIRDRNPLF